MSHPDDAMNISRNQLEITSLQCANIDDHINLGRTMLNGCLCLEGFYFRCGCSQWKANHCTDFNLRSLQELRTQTYPGGVRSEEHTSELQSQSNLVCRLLLEKKKRKVE